MTELERWRRRERLSYAKLAAKLEESTTSVFEWCNAISLPRQAKWSKISRITKLSKAQIVGLA